MKKEKLVKEVAVQAVANENSEAKPKLRTVELEKCKIISVSSLNTIASVAEANGIDVSEVFVRVVFEYKGTEFKVSQKVRILGKTDYQRLLEAAKAEDTDEKKLVDLVINEAEFFYVKKNASIDDIFKTTAKPRSSVLGFFDKLDNE